jgi:hypothetical protein
MHRTTVSVFLVIVAALLMGGCGSVEHLGGSMWKGSESLAKKPAGDEIQRSVDQQLGPGLEAIQIVSSNPLGNDMKIVAVRNTKTGNIRFFHMGSKGILKSIAPAAARSLGLWAAYGSLDSADFQVSQNQSGNTASAFGLGEGGDATALSR